MDRIDHSTATEAHQFTEGNPALGVPATVVTEKWLNGVQEELVGIIAGAGIVLDAEDTTQLGQAISFMIANYARTRLTEDIVVTVGPGGDFSSITQAISFLSRTYYSAGDGYIATVLLRSGFVWAESVALSCAFLPWVSIASEDAVVQVQRSAIPDGAAVFAGDRCIMPELLAPLAMDSSGTAGSHIGIHLIGSVLSMSGGFRDGDWRNIVVQSNSSLSATGCDFSGAGDIGVYVQDSRAVIDSSDVSSCATNGIMGMRSSFISAASSNADNCGVGMKANMGAVITAWSSHAVNCATYGYHAADLGQMQVTSADASGAGTYGYCVTSGAMLNRRASTGSYSQALITPTTHGIIF
ncbi:right-handed parallel beta-helix repeat-containing protein [Pseudodesulfovibrio indicus]|uniref:Right handed beta helix domain-containing protein n=1 Tax=Pseudodesulfovibrio indicus TaxID=1716143 RepID=A0A140D8Z3_9BACT|nr:right-handed parallel beta-helix repeat-containing protein [Pseudodesulfovibrio indicus]AMK09660.1 hypothetical protein AWY79_00320 [Pseudodesulfovibrio indicus]TDT86388.1 hypothetical protein EDC59_11364 [Pseudodesulfovibrio indicus]